jgi:hypothetical protein
LLWGLLGAAVASVVAAVIAAVVSFTIGFIRFDLQVPWAHTVRIALASAAMGATLMLLPTAHSIALLIGYVGLGAVVFMASLALLSLRWLIRLRASRRLSAAE